MQPDWTKSFSIGRVGGPLPPSHILHIYIEVARLSRYYFVAVLGELQYATYQMMFYSK